MPIQVITSYTHPNVAPEPAMYCPSVRIMPFVPAPYRKMLTVPTREEVMLVKSVGSVKGNGSREARTEYEADNDTDGYRSVNLVSSLAAVGRGRSQTYCLPSWRPSLLDMPSARGRRSSACSSFA